MKNIEIENFRVYDDHRKQYLTVKLEFEVKNNYAYIYSYLGFGYGTYFGVLENVQANLCVEDLLACIERECSGLDNFGIKKYRFVESNTELFRKAKIRKALRTIKSRPAV